MTTFTDTNETTKHIKLDSLLQEIYTTMLSVKLKIGVWRPEPRCLRRREARTWRTRRVTSPGAS